ncbi:ppdK [Symbiodinium microadriaticum]|nr:ppdK [Symbiodinium microadriaticum]CAE7876300.1 ppdK [Symbiodinium sp. KB8]
MLLNSTMKLGYLEGSMLDDLGIRAESRRPTLKLDEKGFEVSGPRPSRTSLRPGSNQSQRGFQKETLNSLSRSTSKDRPASQGRVSLKGTRENKLQRSFSREASLNPSTPGAVEEPGPSWQALEWTRPPQKDVRREGASVYSVSTPATQGAREHQPHLVRTTRIEPAAKGYANKRPPVPPKKAEQIVVTEKDLRRCGSDLQKLRECSISTPSKPMEVVMKPAPVEETQKFELSFKSNFAKICRESADPRDPWEGVGHPDELRELTVEDLVLNQVYIHALSPRKIEFDVNSSPEQGTRKPKLLRSASASTRASSADVALQTWPTDDRREGFSRRVPRVRPRPGLPPAGGKRASSVPRDSMEGAEGGKATRPEGQGAIQPISTDTPRTAREDETPPHKRAMRSFLKGAASRGETRAVSGISLLPKGMAASKWVYDFGEGKADGRAEMKNLLGGKGANLAEMAAIGLPVPPGFTLTTEICTYFYEHGCTYPKELKTQVQQALALVESRTGRKFGDATNPLLVSVRSGARASMPGMMDTVLNLGLNDVTVESLAKQSGDRRFAFDSYRRFVQMYSDVVLNIELSHFEKLLDRAKEKRGVRLDNELLTEDLENLTKAYKARVELELGREFPEDPQEQLWGAIGAVFNSWMNQRAKTYRQLHDIPESWGTAVNVQAMVFGNMGNDCATGVAFTRNPSNGTNDFYGEFLVNAQGEDVVAGIRTPQELTIKARQSHGSELPSLEEVMPKVFQELMDVRKQLENHFLDMQDSMLMSGLRLWV